MKNKPAGWCRDLGDRRQHGYWDGNAWVDPQDEGPSSETPEDALDDDVGDDVDAP